MSLDNGESNIFNNAKAVILPTPTSFSRLPKLSPPNEAQIKQAIDLEKSFIQQCQISPGTYSNFKDVMALISVHDRLWDTLESHLSQYNALDICKHLYQKLEIIYGYLHLSSYQAAAAQSLTGRTTGAEKRFNLWRAVTPTTEGIKFLLESAIKCCDDHGWVTGVSKLDFLIAVASEVIMLDEHLESIYNQIIPYEITIDESYNIHAGIASKSIDAIDKFRKSTEPHAVQANWDFLERLKHINGPKIKINDFITIPELHALDKAMDEELGYGLFDWLNYAQGCLQMFSERDFLMVIGVPRFKRKLKDTVGLSSEKVDLLLMDHAISKNTVNDLSRNDMMPISNYRRDSRLLRRPLLEITQDDARVLISGIETLSVGTQVFYDSLQYGTLQLPRMQQKGPIKAAMGILQGKIGAPFRDDIATKCRQIGFNAETEWPIPRKNTSDKPLGPIDVLVIDHKYQRFVLVEAKNLQSQGIIPKEMKTQRDRFLGISKQDEGYLQVLKAKEQAFIENKEWHLRKLNMDLKTAFSVESVIIVFHPIIWPLFASQPLPILDDLEFYNRLKSGQHFLTVPV